MDSRPLSMINLSSPALDLSFTSFDQTPKASPDRYRRPAQKRNDSINAAPKSSAPQLTLDPSAANQPSLPPSGQTSVDDTAVPTQAKRYRRRSLNQLDTQNMLQTGAGAQRPGSGGASATSTPTTIRPVSIQKTEIDTPQRLSSSTPPQVDAAGAADKTINTTSVNASQGAGQKVAVPPGARQSLTSVSQRLHHCQGRQPKTSRRLPGTRRTLRRPSPPSVHRNHRRQRSNSLPCPIRT